MAESQGVSLTDESERLIDAIMATGRYESREVAIGAALRDFAAKAARPRPTSTAILEGIGDGFFACTADWRISYFNRAAEQFFRRPRGDLLGLRLWDAMPAFVGSEFGERYMRVMMTRKTDGFRLPSVIWPNTWVEVRAFPTEDGGIGVSFRDVTEARRAEEALRRSERRYRFLIDATTAVVWTMPPSGEYEGDIPGWQAFTGQSLAEARGQGWLTAIHPDDRAATRAAWSEAIATGEPYTMEHRVRRADSAYRIMVAQGIPIRGCDGSIEEWVGIHTDVTDARLNEQHQRLLIGELNHRVKNLLTTVQSIASQSLRSAPSPEEARDAFSARLHALSRVHDVLTRERWDGADLADVVANAIEPYDDGAKSRFSCSGPSLRLVPKPAQSIAMALHELSTNAVKYGALSSDAGRVAIRWRIDGPTLHLSWTESGGPPVTPPVHRGFGSKLVERGLAAELEGTARLAFEPGGVVCEIVAPLAVATGEG
jgi:PAS domain S-box-containing protein